MARVLFEARPNARLGIDIRMKPHPLLRYFIVSASIVLFITGVAKLLSSFGTDRILSIQDPLFNVTYRGLFRIVGTLELAVACMCMFGNRISLQFGLVAWLSTVFGIYRISLVYIGYCHPCPCLGSLTALIHISPVTADKAMRLILAFLLVGSYASLFFLWWQKRRIFTPGQPPQAPNLAS